MSDDGSLLRHPLRALSNRLVTVIGASFANRLRSLLSRLPPVRFPSYVSEIGADLTNHALNLSDPDAETTECFTRQGIFSSAL